MTETEEKPEISFAGRVYGEIIYWGTVLGSIISIIGSIVTFVTKRNYINPAYLLSAIWQGKSVKEIWEGATGSLPNGHWYLNHIFTGNGLAMAGLALGVFVVVPAIFGAAIFLFKEKKPVFGILAIIAGVITIASMLGLVSVH